MQVQVAPLETLLTCCFLACRLGRARPTIPFLLVAAANFSMDTSHVMCARPCPSVSPLLIILVSQISLCCLPLRSEINLMTCLALGAIFDTLKKELDSLVLSP